MAIWASTNELVSKLFYILSIKLIKTFNIRNISWETWDVQCKIFLKKWANPGLFLVYFSSFLSTILQKNCWLQQNSNLDRQSRRRARWPLDHRDRLNTLIEAQNISFDQTVRDSVYLFINWISFQRLVSYFCLNILTLAASTITICGYEGTYFRRVTIWTIDSLVKGYQ